MKPSRHPISIPHLSALLCSVFAIWGIVVTCIASEAPESPQISAEQAKFFESKVRPLLVENCFKCHGEEAQKGSLRLDSRGGMLLGGESGPAIVPGEPEKSLLMEAVRHESFEMPPSKKLRDEEIRILESWIRAGAPWPGDDGKVATRANRKEFTDEDRAWWSYQPLKQPEIPKIDDGGWGRNEIDAFILEQHLKHQLTPAPEASRETLIRRLYFDLLGIPPTPDEVREFVQNEDPYAYEHLVDRLLERPEYGERWARHWLDLVRYADSDGYRADGYRPTAWRYRDYVIQSFNEDKPYDRFVQEQLAGDELFPGDPQALIATGFLRHGIYEYNSRDVRGQWDLILNELTDTTADVFLGMGLQCARCHDHKFDPILQTDYYRLRAFFEPLLPRDDLPAVTPEALAEFNEKKRRYDEKTAQLQTELAALEQKYRDRGEKTAVGRFPDDIQEIIRKPDSEKTPHEKQLAALAWRQVIYEWDRIDGMMKGEEKEKILALRRELAKFAKERPDPLPLAMAATDVGPDSSPTVVPRKQIEVQPGFPSILAPEPPTILPVEPKETTGRRATLARWITHPENPVGTRVIVNRIWQFHFGRGLVENSSDFGRHGSPPTHPELLDWLANRFVRDGWRFKSLHRLIVTSSTYRQSSTHPNSALYQTIDPANQWWWRAPTRRLDAEQIRDSILAVSGQLTSARGGPGVQPDQPRRSIYTRYMRNSRDELLDVFDLPLFFSSAAGRDTTTSPVQSLLLINSQIMLGHAEKLANAARQKLPKELRDDPQAIVAQVWRMALCREPTSEEVRGALTFLKQQQELIEEAQRSSEAEQMAELSIGKMPYRDGQSLLIQPGDKQELLLIENDPKLNVQDFTIEVFFQLRSIFDSGSVRTIVSKVSTHGPASGWSFGVTGKGSRRKPQTLVLQAFGLDAQGVRGEAAIFSDQHVEINKPYYAAVSFRMGSEGKPGTATFYLKDLSNDDEPIQVVSIPHNLVGGLDNDAPLHLGCRSPGSGQFDGLIDDVRLSRQALARNELLYASETVAPMTVGYWQFESAPGIFHDTSPNQLNIRSMKPGRHQLSASSQALIDLCHVLFNSNEFLYVD